ncbi:uncharacterized protein METZ01_LOCUS135301, partial [marine metagenome]
VGLDKGGGQDVIKIPNYILRNHFM